MQRGIYPYQGKGPDRCTQMKKQKEPAIRAITKWTIIIAASIILFILAKEVALQERGYRAIGGEYALLTLPFLYYAAEISIKDYIKANRENKECNK